MGLLIAWEWFKVLGFGSDVFVSKLIYVKLYFNVPRR